MGRNYTKEYRIEAIKLAQEIGPKKASEELGVPSGTIGGWLREARIGKIDMGLGTQTPQGALTLAAELQECRRKIKEQEKEIARLEKTNEFLEEASRFFAASRKK